MNLKHWGYLFGLEALITGIVNSPCPTLTIRKVRHSPILFNQFLLQPVERDKNLWKRPNHPNKSEMSPSLEDPVCFLWLRDGQQLGHPAWVRNLPSRQVTLHETHLPPDIQDPFKNLIMSAVAVTNTAFPYLCFPEASFDSKCISFSPTMIQCHSPLPLFKHTHVHAYTHTHYIIWQSLQISALNSRHGILFVLTLHRMVLVGRDSSSSKCPAMGSDNFHLYRLLRPGQIAGN